MQSLVLVILLALLGEIFLCYPQVILLATERSKRSNEMINRMVEHGLKNILEDKKLLLISNFIISSSILKVVYNNSSIMAL